MDLAKSEEIMILMRRYGVEHFKTLEFEVKLAPIAMEIKPFDKKDGLSQSEAVSKKIPEPQAIPPTEMKIPHHLNQVASLLKLNDNDLVEKLFPDGSHPPPKEVDNA